MSVEFEARLESKDHLTRLLCRFIVVMGGRAQLSKLSEYVESLGLDAELVLPRLRDMGFDIDDGFVTIMGLGVSVQP